MTVHRREGGREGVGREGRGWKMGRGGKDQGRDGGRVAWRGEGGSGEGGRQAGRPAGLPHRHWAVSA